MKTEKTGKKRRKLPYILSVLIILGTGLAAFYTGWIQFQLDAGEYGVIYTKSHGWEENTVKNGEFSWRWQALFPTNLSLHIYKIMPNNALIKRSGSLPSGHLYAALIDENAVFDWNISTKIRYRIIPERLPLLAAEGISATDLPSLYDDYEARLGGLLSDIIDENIADIQEIEQQLKRRANALDRNVEVADVSIISWELPDMSLYEEAQRRFVEIMEQRTAIVMELQEKALRRDDTQESMIDLLSRYGEVFTDHPILLELFALEGNPALWLLPNPLSEAVE